MAWASKEGSVRLAFIGGGTMAEAIIAAVLQKGVARPADIVVGEPVEARRAYLAEKYRVKAVARNPQAAFGDLIVLAVKPQDLGPVLAELRGKVKPGQIVLSIVAGARLATLIAGLGHPGVIRVMPNTPAQVMAGMSVWTAPPEVPADRREAARKLLQALGEELYVADEKYVDMATALSASGPAYVWLFLEALIDAGVHIGIPRPMASTLALQTLLGSAQMSRQTGKHPAELRNMVTSPGGTTTEALLALEEGGFRARVIQAVEAAYKKSLLLGKEG
jgi:pyrroline-5-carboxylate reductase